ncbi:MAG: Crp/Fnr family transcriptional regulator [Rhodospirillaceae bacterium]|nr:Crp/Fnr family transcriptional regulator [Rhodospirillaceae bacterium]
MQRQNARRPKASNSESRRRASSGGPADASKLRALVKFNAQAFLDTVGVGRFIGKYAAGEVVYLQGDAADAVYYIQKGKIQITVVSKQGKQGVIALLGAGEFFGEGCLAGQPLHIASATVTAEAAIVKIEKHTMIRVMRDEPTLSQIFMTFLLSRSVQVEADLIDHLFNSSEKRLARILLLLANIGKEGQMEAVPRINQDVLAARVGTTRSRINFFMNKFRKLGFIEYNGSLKVHSSLLNVIVYD